MNKPNIEDLTYEEKRSAWRRFWSDSIVPRLPWMNWPVMPGKPAS
jgi:hypothetical protein